MTRDHELIFWLLEYVSARHRGEAIWVPDVPESANYTDAQVHYHVGLCVDAGYLVADEPKDFKGKRRYSHIHGLTWSGHDKLEEIQTARQRSNRVRRPSPFL